MRRSAWPVFLALAFVSVLLGSAATNQVLAYNGDTHRVINERILDLSEVSLYFDKLGIPLSSSRFQGQAPLQLFRAAGANEDEAWYTGRAANHFHDPLRSWDQAGFTHPIWPDGISSILWAQYDQVQPQPPPYYGINVWTWGRAYDSFLSGLTDQDATSRDQKLADLFTTLGRLTHLVADVSVAQHTRNDFHLFRNYETWCSENLQTVHATIDGVPVYDDRFPPDLGIFAQSQSLGFGHGPLSPISNLWDSYPDVTPQDNGYNGALWVQDRRLEGLADYSNFNYFSDDTVFSGYLYPSRGSSVPYVSDVTGIVIPRGGFLTPIGLSSSAGGPRTTSMSLIWRQRICSTRSGRNFLRLSKGGSRPTLMTTATKTMPRISSPMRSPTVRHS